MALLRVLTYERNLSQDSYFYTGIFDNAKLSYKVIETGSTAYGYPDDYVEPYSSQWNREDIESFKNNILPSIVGYELERQTLCSRSIKELQTVKKGDHLVLMNPIAPRKIWSNKINFALPAKPEFKKGAEVVCVGQETGSRYFRIAVESESVRFFINNFYDVQFSPRTKPDVRSSGDLLADFKKFSRFDRWYLPV